MDLCFDPLIHKHNKLPSKFSENFPTPTGQIFPQNMTNFWGQHQPTNTPFSYLEGEFPPSSPDSPLSNITSTCLNLVDSPLLTTPICISPVISSFQNIPPLFHNDMVTAAASMQHFPIAVFGFNSRNFAQTLKSYAFRMRVVLATDTNLVGQGLFHTFTDCRIILPSSQDVLTHVQTSKDISPLQFYLIHSQQFTHLSSEHQFWMAHLSIFCMLQSQCTLQIVLIHVHPSMN